MTTEKLTEEQNNLIDELDILLKKMKDAGIGIITDRAECRIYAINENGYEIELLEDLPEDAEPYYIENYRIINLEGMTFDSYDEDLGIIKK